MSKSNVARTPAKTPEARERQLCALAVDLAEQQLRDGTASSQIITHYLKLATEREKLETERVRAEVQLAESKAKAIDAERETQAAYKEAMAAFARYSGQPELAEGDDYIVSE